MRYPKVVTLCLAVLVVATAGATQVAAAATPAWFECSELYTAGTGGWKNESCSEADATKKSNFERVTIVPTKFTSLSNEVKFEALTNVVTCKESTSSGEIEEPGAAKGVVVKLFGCKGEETLTKKTCEIKSIKPTGGKEEIVLNTLKGELGTVSKTEAASGAGLLLIPESGAVITEVEGSCLTVTKPVIEGSFISEVAPVGKVQNGTELIAKAVEKKQKIQKFEGGAQKVLTTTILGSKHEVPITDIQRVTFAENAQIGEGEQVQPRFVPFFAWKVNGFELQPTEERTVQELKATVAGITIEGKVGATLYKITCTNMAEIGAEKKIIGGRLGKMRTTWEFAGCTMPAPANCAVENQRVLTEALEGFIVQGVGRSSDQILLFFRPVTEPTFMIVKAINNGGNCSVAGNVTIAGSVSTEALDRAEAFYPEFLFEPVVKTTIQWRTGGQNGRRVAGLVVGTEETTISGITLFAVKAPNGQNILGFEVT